MQQHKPEMHFNDYLQILKSRKSDVITFFLTIVLIVAGASFMMRPTYRATCALLIDVESPNVLTATDSVALDTTSYYAYKEYFQSQKEIIKSRSIAREAFEKLNLDQNEDPLSSQGPLKVLVSKSKSLARQAFEKLNLDQEEDVLNSASTMQVLLSKSKSLARQIFEKLNLDQEESSTPAKEDPIKTFLKAVKVESVRDTRLLLLHVENKDPQLVAEIANSLAEVYVARNLAYITRNEVLNLLKNEYLRLQAKHSELSKVYKHKHPKMMRINQEIEQITSNIKAEKEQTTDASGSVFSGLKANNVVIQDRAEVPLTPVKPNLPLNILLAMVVGLFGGTGLAFWFEYLDDTVDDFKDVEKIVKWPFLGYVPKMNGVGSFSGIKRDRCTQLKPKDPASEAYRAIRTSVLFSATEEHPLKSIIITSPGPREGKTSVICNLGITMAQSQKQVLLVDADMRKPRLHTIFGSKNEVGLSSFLSGQADFSDLVQETEIESLFLISGGPRPPNPSELLTSRRMRQFIDEARYKFDIILFDSPPVAVVTDAVILSRAVDGTIIVLESGRTNTRVLPRTEQVLKDARARVIGTLLNKISPKHRNYYYYKNYYK